MSALYYRRQNTLSNVIGPNQLTGVADNRPGGPSPGGERRSGNQRPYSSFLLDLTSFHNLLSVIRTFCNDKHILCRPSGICLQGVALKRSSGTQPKQVIFLRDYMTSLSNGRSWTHTQTARCRDWK